MNLRTDLFNTNNQALILYLIIMSQKNTNNLNNIIIDLRLRDFINTDYINAIDSIIDTKKKAISDINKAAEVAISQTTIIATEAKHIAQEAKQLATESKQLATESKQLAQEAKQLAEILFTDKNPEYIKLIDKINEAYNLATESKDLATEAKDVAKEAKDLATESKQLATESKQLATESKDLADATKIIVDTLSSNQNNKYDDLLKRIDYLFYEFYRTTSSDIIETYGMRP